MVSARDRFLGLADRLRSKAAATQLSGVAGFDVRPTGVSVVVRTWVVGIRNPLPATLGADYTDETLVLVPTPKVRELGTREIASSGGVYVDGDVRIDRITPAYVGLPEGGYTPEQIAPRAPVGSTKVEVFYRLTGPLAGVYRRVDSRNDKALEYTLTVRRLRDTP